MEILLIHPGGLGDIILSLPAVSLLREKYPAARLTIAANLDHLAPIVGYHADAAISLSTLPLHNLYGDQDLPVSDLRFWRSFDRIISWTGSGRPVFVRKMTGIHPNARIASWRPGPHEHRHVSQLFIDSLDHDVKGGRNAIPARIALDSELSGQGRQWLSDRGWNGRDSLVVLHPGAGSQAKRWPLARFISLAQRLILEERKRVLVIEGPAEFGLAAKVTQELPAGEAMMAGSLPLNTLAAVIAHAQAFVGNDAGIAHLTAALGIPSIVIFGPTLPQHWAPLGRHVKVLKDSRDCKACNLGGNDHTCLENIDVEEVIRNLKRISEFVRI